MDKPLVDDIAQTAIHVLKKSSTYRDFLIERIRNEGETPEEFVLYRILGKSAKILESGQCHIWRGALDLSGVQYKAIFDRSVDLLVEGGYTTKEWAENVRQRVNEHIKNVG